MLAAALVAVSCGLIGPFVVMRGMAFAVHGTAELAFTGAAAGLLVANNPVVGALVGAVVVAVLISVFGAGQQERDSAIGVILAFGMGIGVLLLGFYQGFATAATNILFGDIFGVSGSQLVILLVICLIVMAVMGVCYRPSLFASVDPDVAEAQSVPVGKWLTYVETCDGIEPGGDGHAQRLAEPRDAVEGAHDDEGDQDVKRARLPPERDAAWEGSVGCHGLASGHRATGCGKPRGQDGHFQFVTSGASSPCSRV